MEDIAVLLVSEDKEKSSIVRYALTAMDINRVRVVYSYEDALSVLKHKTATMLLVEMSIPKSQMTALTFVQTLRKDLENFAHVQDAPIILLAGGASRHDVEVARDSGATEFVVYPFSVAYLRTVIKSVIHNPRKFIISEGFFGPDRRRKNDDPPWGADRRKHKDEEDDDY